MTNIKRVLALMADGKPRTRAQIQDELGWTYAQAENTIRNIRASGGMSLLAPPPIYTISKLGFEALAKPELDKATIAQRAKERRVKRRRLSAAERSAKNKDSALMTTKRDEQASVRAQEIAEKLEKARRANEALSFIHKASTGQVPNSIFAMGGML